MQIFLFVLFIILILSAAHVAGNWTDGYRYKDDFANCRLVGGTIFFLACPLVAVVWLFASFFWPGFENRLRPYLFKPGRFTDLRPGVVRTDA